MPIRGIQDYLSSGEATEAYFDSPMDGNQLLKKSDIESLIPPTVQVTLADGSVTTIYKGGTADGNQVLNKQEVLALPPAEIATVNGMEYIPQATPPAHEEGLTFYDDEAKALTVYSDIPDFALNIGQEVVVRVVNNTGLSIPNAAVCYEVGVSNGVPQVALASASALATARILGVSTHAILDGEIGFVTAFGKLGGDFSTFAVNDTLYLDNITPGGLTTDPPDITTQVGTVLDNTIDGSLLVRIANVIALPTAIGWMYGLSTQTYNLVDGAAATPLIGYDGEDSIFLPADAVNGQLDIPNEGVYRITTTFTATFTADAKNGRTFMLDLYDVTGAVLITSFGFAVPTDSNIITGAVSAPTRILSEHLIQLQIRCLDDDLDGVQFQNISFAAESIQIK